ncbi:MAG: hypothetical protein ACE5JR_03040 [Gemmatimonadota bacterium]
MTDPLETAKKFADELAVAFGDELRSVLLYGSVPRGEAVPGVSDINVLVLVERIRLAGLGNVSSLARRWIEGGNTAPLLLSWHDWAHSADAFAVEIADMKQHHKVLRGDDPLAELQVVLSTLRHQTEHELRGKMVQLHEGLMLAAPKPEELGRLLLTALPSFTTYLRTTLRLGGRAVPDRTEEMIPAAASVVGGEPDAFLRAWRARITGKAPAVRLDDPFVAGYYGLVERTVEWVDGLMDR